MVIGKGCFLAVTLMVSGFAHTETLKKTLIPGQFEQIRGLYIQSG